MRRQGKSNKLILDSCEKKEKHKNIQTGFQGNSNMCYNARAQNVKEMVHFNSQSLTYCALKHPFS